MDHEAMKHVVECTCYSEVQSILNESRETAFKEEIWVYKQHESHHLIRIKISISFKISPQDKVYIR